MLELLFDLSLGVASAQERRLVFGCRTVVEVVVKERYFALIHYIRNELLAGQGQVDRSVH